NGESCPAGAGCASDQLCHPIYTAGAGPADAGSYLCAQASPQCPPDEVCGSDNLCGAGDGGTNGCDLATAFSGPIAYPCGDECSGLAVADFNHDGYNDVALAVSDSSTPKGGVSLLLYAGDGTFAAPILSLTLFPCGGDISNPTDY